MVFRVPSYLRTYRKRSGLTQDEVAFLLGCQSGAKVSRFERLARTPSLKTALACQAIFGVLPHEIFSGLHAEVEKTVAERAHLLSRRLQAKHGQGRSGLRHKLTILGAIAAARKQPPQNEA
jgi:transcriptional regulator with XRE-family HTH domain